MMDAAGVMQMPKQEVNEGQKHGYIGEDTGEVKVIEAREAGDSNVVPSIETAQARVTALENELKKAQRTLSEAKVAASKKSEGTGTAEKPLVGTAIPGPAKSTTPAASGTSSSTPPST